MSEGDFRRNLARLEARDFHRVRGRPLPIKLVDQLELSRVALKPNMVVAVGEGMGHEYVIGRGVAHAFEQAGLTGYSLRSIRHPKTGRAYADSFHLYSEEIMPPVELDATTLPPNLGPNPWTRRESFRRLGCLTYALRGEQGLCDFNRTAENWSANCLPAWVVSARVRECFQRDGLKGWGFRPVLEKGTDLHERYVALWTDLLRWVAVNPLNRF